MVLTDDIDGSEATQTVIFSYQGVSYEIDLNDDHASAMEESFNDWISAARKTTAASATRATRTRRVKGGAGASGSGRDLNEVRVWLRSKGHEVADRGRIAQTLLEEYNKAH